MTSTPIALVICSTRQARVNPSIARYVLDVISQLNHQETIEILDIADHGPPLYDEPSVPSHLPEADPTPHYAHQHTRSWSATVQRYSAFIFVTPQYNWSIPASLKNALDYLFYEWKGKPAAIVTYGGRGGGKAADHLRAILQGLRMKPVLTAPGLVVKTAAMESGGNMENRETWRGSEVEEKITAMFLELVEEMRV
ncbi:unnamed protein product [Penicillium salamii]|uniref:NADPH-dependent FMN reductase-like domain-containing protein n=1 Tax=Penicillium salamii TaxID=1612424 RepID=A0A9W4JM68_9EURO|nr:unnamed protein product [Penicillium salamii]CAG8304225.1 unnamed protein product [Penicillium salamii]CAG8367034.1 unnamed protein product [Penicillium salamii]CAG8398739.1 unnamed protein product [Penicillium salamii]CAG8408326.1 unnamed protein product [Penicillium salamii]